MTITDYKQLIETRLGISNALLLDGTKLIPNKALLTKAYIKTNLLDDLFQYHNGKLVFTNRLLHLVAELTNRQVLTGHYHLEMR